MKLKHPLLQKTLGLFGAAALAAWRQTIDWQTVYADPTVDPVHPRYQGRYIYACWHECLLMPIMLRGHRRMLALVSQHADAEIIGTAMQHLGWSLARGSSKRGGVSAMLRLLRADDRCLNLAPDGPRGPRRVMSPGAIFLASKLGLPIVCVGYSFERPWRLRSWDRFAVPRPFTRGRAVFGPPLRVPADLGRDDLERYRLWFEHLLTWLTDDAEAWATSGERRHGAMPMLVKQAPPAMAHWTPDLAVRLPEHLQEGWAALAGNPPHAAAA